MPVGARRRHGAPTAAPGRRGARRSRRRRSAPRRLDDGATGPRFPAAPDGARQGPQPSRKTGAGALRVAPCAPLSAPRAARPRRPSPSSPAENRSPSDPGPATPPIAHAYTNPQLRTYRGLNPLCIEGCASLAPSEVSRKCSPMHCMPESGPERDSRLDGRVPNQEDAFLGVTAVGVGNRMDAPNRINRFQLLPIIGFKPVHRVLPARWRGGSAVLAEVPGASLLLSVAGGRRNGFPLAPCDFTPAASHV